MAGAAAAVVGVILAVFAESLGDWAWIAAAVLGAVALALGLKGRNMAQTGAGSGAIATVAAVVGALLVVGLVVWLVLFALGVVQD